MFQIICSLLVSCSAGLPDDGCVDAEILAGDGESGARLGGSVALSEDTLLVGAWGDDDLGRFAGAAYVYALEGAEWVETQKLHAADGKGWDQFGQHVSLDGDVVVIGASGHRHFGGLARTGAAYVFRRQGPTWVQEAELLPDEPGDVRLGSSVSLSGNVMLIGATADSERGEWAGAAYVFRYANGVWSREAKLFSNDIKPGDQFGGSVSISGNLAVVGARAAKERGRYSAGAAFVFRFDDGHWGQVAKLLPHNGKLFEFFGRATAISGEAVFVSASTHSTGTGAIFVFGPGRTKWRELDALTPQRRDFVDLFGNALAASGDTLLVGAPSRDPGDRGAVFLFRFDGVAWREEATLWARNGEPNDYFGGALAVSGGMALVGASGRDDFGTNSGAAYVLDLNCVRECDRYPRPQCDGDVTGNGVVDLVDVGTVRASMGSTFDRNLCKYDLDCDGRISPVDVGIVLSLVDTCHPPRSVCPSDQP